MIDMRAPQWYTFHTIFAKGGNNKMEKIVRINMETSFILTWKAADDSYLTMPVLASPASVFAISAAGMS
jgi:hypothetical protein